ncbi:hypothetical protein DVH24_042415 [Malus domestica]|uniref:Pentacotripeptide-repeat region of PRORP domain-containing protein n=1 Tax=Malus domestica TaxID=3750 RepID=A0A498J1W0_MALDO|nr:hypothetical protein DVH24_042415 [Malus domestica]
MLPCPQSCAVFFNNYLAFFHSQSSNPKPNESTNTHPKKQRLVRERNPPTKIGNLEDALSLFNVRLRLRSLPSVVCFTQILGQLGKVKRYSAVISLYNQMGPNTFQKVVGGPCKPNVITFNTLIKGFYMTGNNSVAIQLLRKMKERGCKPDTVPVLLEMISNGVPLSPFRISLIHGVLHARQVERRYKAVERNGEKISFQMHTP